MDNDKTIPGNQENPLKIEVKHEGDRRVYERVPTMAVVTKVKVKPSAIRTPAWQTVEMIDYSRRGFAFLSPVSFKLGQSLKVYIQLVIDSTEISISDVFATIRSVGQENDQWRYGAEFNFDAGERMRSPELKAKLDGIERLVKRAIARKHNSTP